MTLLTSLKRTATRLAGVSLGALSAALLATAPVHAEPALWVVKDTDSTIYLFGTIHVLKPETQWRTPALDAAIKSAVDLRIETSEGENPAATQQLVMQLGLSPQTPLSSRLTAEEKTKLTAAATAAGLPPAALEAMRPWLAALTLTVAPIIKAGYDPTKGVDKVLETEARAAGRPVETFETVEQQLRFFADLPPEMELDFLRATLDDANEGVAVVDRMAAAWAAGDEKTLDALIVEDLRKDYPAVYNLLLKDRNVVWSAEIKRILAGSGTHFIAVGAGHLVGPDSVQAQLKGLGIASTRQR